MDDNDLPACWRRPDDCSANRRKNKGTHIKSAGITICLLAGVLLSPGALAQDRRAEALALTCYTCHSRPHPGEDGIPSLQKLDREELIRKLTAFRDGGADATIMDRIAAAFSDEEIALIAGYITGRDGAR